MSTRGRPRRQAKPTHKAMSNASRNSTSNRNPPYQRKQPTRHQPNNQEIRDNDQHQQHDTPNQDNQQVQQQQQPLQQQQSVTEMLGQIMDRLDSVERTVAEAAPQVPCPPDAQIPGNPQISHNSGFETEKQATPNDKGEFELEPQNRPLQQYGSLVGDDIKQKLASEIRADKFINFSELLPNPK